MAESAAAAAIKVATKDLLFPSESDEPIDVVEWKAEGKLTTSRLIELGEEDPRVHIKEISVDAFFKNLIESSPDDSPDEQRGSARFRNLLDVLKAHLSDIRVFRVGQIQINYYVVGLTSTGTWTGLVAPSTET
jgi:hypothetical protein